MNVVVPRLGARKTVLIGSVLVSLSTILASLTNDLTSLICVHSVLMGKGLLYHPQICSYLNNISPKASKLCIVQYRSPCSQYDRR